MKAKSISVLLFTILFACRKESPLVLDGSLTDCATCTYHYYDNADYKNTFQPIAGNYRVFQYKNGNDSTCGPTSSIFFKAPLYEDQFIIDSAQIAAGTVIGYYFSCPCCEEAYFPNNPMGGQIKAKQVDGDKWLVNATVVMGYQNKPLDTIIVNQYFTSKSL
jgi:hypothetical protein